MLYRPSALCQLHVRLDPGAAPLPPEAIALLQGGPVTPYVGTSLESIGEPASDGFSVILQAPPISVQHERNGLRMADALTATFELRNVPIPARMIRSMAILFYAGTVSHADYQRGIEGGVRSTSGTNAAIVAMERRNLRFVGHADDTSMTCSAGQVSFTFRDLSAILIDTKVPADELKALELTGSLASVIRVLLDGMPGGQGRGLRVLIQTWVENGIALPLPDVSKAAPKSMKFRRGTSCRLPPSIAGSDVTYWDLITTLCSYVGYVPVLTLDELRLMPPRNVYTRVGAGLFTDQGRLSPRPGEGEAPLQRRMVHGSNLTELTFDRKFGRLRVPGVHVTSWSPGMAAPLSAYYPPEADPSAPKKKANHVAPSGRSAHEKIETINVRAVRDEAELARIARSLFEELGNAEYGGRFETADLASLGPNRPGGAAWDGGNDDPDLLDMVTGDPIEVVVSGKGTTQGVLSTLAGIEDGAPPVQVAHLVSRGIAENVATALVNLYRETRNMQTVFRVKDVKTNWTMAGQNPSVNVSVGFATYLEVRDGAPSGEAALLSAANVHGGSQVVT